MLHGLGKPFPLVLVFEKLTRQFGVKLFQRERRSFRRYLGCSESHPRDLGDARQNSCGTWAIIPRYPAYSVLLSGFVELREESQKTDRFVLRVDHIDGNRVVGKPARVRLSVRRGLTPPAGAFVEVKAQLNPPLQPLRPGSYDFGRDLYFQRIGASGFVHGAIKIVTPPAAAGVRLRANAFIQGVRDGIDQRIRSRSFRRRRLHRLGTDHRQARRDYA